MDLSVVLYPKEQSKSLCLSLEQWVICCEIKLAVDLCLICKKKKKEKDN